MSPSVQIGIETSQRKGSIAICAKGTTFCADLEDGRRHASDLLPALDRLCEEAGLPRGRDLEVDAVSVGVGPGSYTGLRVGIAFALGLLRGSRRASPASALSVASGEVQCWSHLEVGESSALLLDARQGELYFAQYERTDDDVRVLQAPCVIAAPDWRKHLPPTGKVFGDATVAKAAGLDAEAEARLVLHPARADALLELAARRLSRGIQTPWDELEPLYLRPFGNPLAGSLSAKKS